MTDNNSHRCPCGKLIPLDKDFCYNCVAAMYVDDAFPDNVDDYPEQEIGGE